MKKKEKPNNVKIAEAILEQVLTANVDACYTETNMVSDGIENGTRRLVGHDLLEVDDE